MTKTLNVLILTAALHAATLAAEKKIALENLPPAVQNAVKQVTQNATLLGVIKEVEGGKTMYEVETKLNGKSRDLMLDRNGAVISVEQEVSLEAIPAPAQAAITQKVGAGKINKVETVTKGSDVSYEAAYTTKSGRSAEVGVNADGSAHK